MAGILFTDGNLVLAGYNHLDMKIDGIGGKCEGNETPIKTAIREMVEELFELEETVPLLLEALEKNLTFDFVMGTGSYTIFVMDFQYDLEIIFNTLKQFELKSKVYNKIPESISDLLIKRIPNDFAEFSQLILIPCSHQFDISPLLLTDIFSFKTYEKNMR